MNARFALAVLVVLASPCRARTVDGTCGTFPASVMAAPYNGASDCILHTVGERPLWHGIAEKSVRQKIRFTFTDGHGRYLRTLDLTEHADGSGNLVLKSIARDDDGRWVISSQHSRLLSAEQVLRIDALSQAAGVWDFPVGSWDGDVNSKRGRGSIYLHCEMLEMERATPDDYRFSSINISCNHPAKLMPLVDYITDLARLKPALGGLVY